MRTPQSRHRSNHDAVRRILLPLLSSLAVLAIGQTAYSASPELGWSFPPAGPLRVHVVRGYSYYGRDYRIEEVLVHAGANLFTNSSQEDRSDPEASGDSSNAGWLMRCPDAAGFAMDHHLVIVSSINASEFGNNGQVLVDYVKNGGSVLFLCGSSSFGGQSEKSVLATMAPLEFPDEGPWRLETEQVSESVELKAGPDYSAEQLPGVTPDNPPRVYSYYKIKPKPNAKVLLVAGDNAPILIVDKFGQGQVAVFTATARGYPKEGQTPYWRWDGWPALLAGTVRQIAATPADAPRGLDEEGRQQVIDIRGKAYDLLDGVNEKKRGDFEAVLHQAGMRCHDKSTAEFVLGLIADCPLGIPNELDSTLGQTLAPWVDSNCAGHAEALIISGDVGKTILGLIALGATHSDDAKSTLEEFLDTGSPRKRDGGEFSLAAADPGTVEAYMQTQENASQIRRAAVMGLGMLGDSAVLPVLQRTTAAYAVDGSFKPDTEIETIEREHFDYQNALVASLLCGDAEAAEPAVDFLLRNLSVVSRTETEVTGRRAAKAWQQQLYRRLTAVPENVLPALAKKIAAENSRNITAAALAIFGGKKLSPEIATILSESSVAPVAELGKRQQEE